MGLAFGVPALDEETRLTVEFAYGYLALFGWVVLTVLGTSWKLFLVRVWQERFAAERAIRPVPAVASLPNALFRRISASAQTGGVLGVATAIVAREPTLLRVALALQLVGTLAFLAHFLSIARHELLQSRAPCKATRSS
ncbi:MAG: hypothetical protein EXS13_14840 [Planctomycetes bacterium]|nr:hypothetical protein [Planctomycetota bacterium]